VTNEFESNQLEHPSKKQSDNDIIKFLMKNLKEVDEDSKKKDVRCGSLYNLFDSLFFDIHFLICYLDKNDNEGIIDTLVNIMYKRFINESFFYLPQLWY
jgi:hypothetical protein